HRRRRARALETRYASWRAIFTGELAGRDGEKESEQNGRRNRSIEGTADPGRGRAAIGMVLRSKALRARARSILVSTLARGQPRRRNPRCGRLASDPDRHAVDRAAA